jgi:hypothetical protein
VERTRPHGRGFDMHFGYWKGLVTLLAGAMYLVLYLGENAARLEVPNAKLTDIKYTNVEDPNGRFYVGKFK